MTVIPRRQFLIAAGALLASPVAGNAQRHERVYRIGSLSANPTPSPLRVFMVDRLRELGWIEQRNLVFENRYTGGDREKIAAGARELVALRVDLIITGGGAETPQAAMEATKSIPIVFLIADDPVRLGLVRNLARPEGNITGLSTMNADLDAKRLQLLKEVLPALKRVGVMWSPIDPSGALVMVLVESAARALGVALEPLPIQRPGSDLDEAFAAAKQRAVEAVMILGTPVLFGHASRIGELASSTGIPTISAWSLVTEAGGLLSYGTNLKILNRRLAEIVDRILKGAKPGDIPVERPTKFDLEINIKSAKTLGIKVPQSLLSRADRLIE